MYQKIEGLVINCGNPAKIYTNETKAVNRPVTASSHEKKRGEKMGFGVPNLLKTNIGKMSTFRLSRILMKTNELFHSFHYVDEKLGS
jgi:hypothetical protein